MTNAAPTGPSRRGRRRWLWAIGLLLLGLPLLAFALSNLWLSSVHGRNWIAAKITAATTLETTVGGASWSPWNGITVREIRVTQPLPLRDEVKEPLGSIAAVRVIPVWREWLQGRPSVRGMEFEAPRIVLPVQLLSHFVQQVPAPVPAAAPAEPPPVASAPGPPSLDNALPTPPPGELAAPDEPPDLPQDPSPTAWIRVKDGSFKLVYAGIKTSLAELDDLDVALPVAGAPAKSQLKLASLKVFDVPTLQNLEAPLSWRSGLLTLGPLETSTSGVKMRLSAKVARVSHMPFLIELQLPEQRPPGTLLPGVAAQADKLAAETRFGGLLAAPQSWQADFVTRAQNLSVTVGQQQTRFSLGGCVVVLRGGVLSCVDARLIGDDFSLLSNGTLLPDGRLAAVIRLVAPPDTAANLTAQIFPGLTDRPAPTPLGTPQRAAFDLEVFGPLSGLSLRLGQRGPVVDLAEALTPTADVQ